MAKKITKEIMDRAYELYQNGKNYKEISKELGIGLSTVKNKLKSEYNVMPMKKLPVIDGRVFKPLGDTNISDKEISKKLDIPLDVVISFKDRFNKFSITSAISKIPNYLKEYVLGSLLGDLYISEINNKGESRLAIVHAKEQESLFMSNVELLGEKMSSYKLGSYLDQRTNKEYFTYRGNSKPDVLFGDLGKLTYSNNGKKLVTEEGLNQINSPLALAYGFMDDGTHRGTIATNSFSEAEVDLLIKGMKDRGNIVCTKQQNVQSNIQYVIHISSHSRYDFEKLIFPFVIPTMYYKLKYASLLLSV